MKRLILVGIIVLSAFFRLYRLSDVPPSPSLDEVSIGYNAYSILTTGKDEYGTLLPMLLRAYDDFRPALYVYLSVPFVWLLGLTVVAVRLPSVLLSLLTVYVTYLIGRDVGKKYLSFERLGEIAAVILAVSPWHIYISRLGHEANIGLTLVTLGIFFFLRAALFGRKSSWILAGIAFGLSLYGYQSEKVVSPLLVLSGSLLFWKEIWKAKRHVLIAIVVGLAIALSAIAATISPQGMVRFRGTSAFATDSPRAVSAVGSYTAALEKGDIVGRFIYSRTVTNASIFIENYVSHFSPVWLFSGGNREAHKVPGMGLLYLWEVLFILAGLWALVKSRIPKRLAAFFIIGLLIAPIPAAMTTQAPHAMRAYTAIPVLQLIEALGAWMLVSKLQKKHLQILAVILGMVISAGVARFWQGYFVRFPVEQSDSFQYAMQPTVRYALKNAGAYSRIEMSNQGSMYQSYMFFLYYSRFDPKRYLELGGTTSGGFEASHAFDAYAFGFLPRRTEDLQAGTLYFYDINLVPEGARVVQRFSNLDGSPQIVAATRQ